MGRGGLGAHPSLFGVARMAETMVGRMADTIVARKKGIIRLAEQTTLLLALKREGRKSGPFNGSHPCGSACGNRAKKPRGA